MMLESNVWGENSFLFIHTTWIGNDLLKIRKMNRAELILKTAYSSAIALAAILKTRSARRLARCLLPAFLCAHIFIKRETSGYEAGETACFSNSLNNKSKANCRRNDAQCLFMCYFSCRARKITIYRGFNLNFNQFFVKFKMVVKMATIVGEVTGLQQRHHP